jgi:MFS family permease
VGVPPLLRRRLISPLRHNRDFLALWVGQAVSNLGISISSFAYPLVVLEETGSAARAGLVGSVLAGTAFVLRLPAGAVVDRLNRRAIMVACDVGRALNAGAFALVLALGHFVYAQVLAVAFVEAALGVLFGPAETAAVRRAVGREHARDAAARNQSRAAVPGLIGPPIAGVLLAAGRALPFAADAVTYLVSLVAVAAVRAPLGGGEGQRGSRPFAGVFDGVRWLWRHAFLRTLLLWLVGAGLVFNSIGLVILVRAREAGGSPAELGAMFAITGAGGVAGALAAPAILRRVRPRAVIVGFAWIATASTLGLLATHSPYALGVLGAIAFLLVPSVTAVAFGTVSQEAPEELQGRATSGAIQLSTLGAPLGPVVAGLLLGRLGASTTLVAYASAMAGLAVVATLSRALRSP